MKQFKVIMMAFMLLATVTIKATAQLQQINQRQQVYKDVPVYATGGFHTLVWNSTTQLLEYTNYPISYDTVNGDFTFYANGTSQNAWQVVTPFTYKKLITASRVGIAGNLHLKDTSGSKYLDLDSHDGITSPDTIWNNTNYFRVETIAGTKSITADSTKLRIDCNKVLMGTGSVQITSGTGNPLFNVSAPVGSLFIRTNGVVDSTLYVKMTGTDSAGWYPLKH